MMTRNSTDIKKNRLYSGAMHELLAPLGFVSPSTVYTKAGDLFNVLRLRGVDTECLDLPAVTAVCQRFEATLRLFGPEYRLYQYMIKRDNPQVSMPGAYLERDD